MLIYKKYILADHNSTIICPITTNIVQATSLTRISLKVNEANLKSNSDIMVDQIRAIDNKRIIKKLGDLPPQYHSVLEQNLRNILDL